MLPEPEVRRIALPSKGARLIIASDGLWDAMNPKTAVHHVRGMAAGKAAGELVRSSSSHCCCTATCFSLLCVFVLALLLQALRQCCPKVACISCAHHLASCCAVLLLLCCFCGFLLCSAPQHSLPDCSSDHVQHGVCMPNEDIYSRLNCSEGWQNLTGTAMSNKCCHIMCVKRIT